MTVVVLRRFVSLIVLGVLFASACTSSSDQTAGSENPSTHDSGSGGSGTPGPSGPDGTIDPASLTASWTGVTPETITIGVLSPDYKQLAELGLIELDRGDAQVIVDSFVNELNDRGGINGRKVEAVLEESLPTSTTSADESCLRLTEDTEVFAVVGTFVGPSASSNACINDQNATIIVGGEPTPELLAGSKAPWITDSMTAERRLIGDVELLHQAGLLEGNVAVAKLADELAIADDIVIPALKDRGYEPVLEWVQDTPVNDIAAGTAAYDVFTELLEANDIDTVVMIENTGSFGTNRVVASDFEGDVRLVDSRQLLDSLGSLGQVPKEDLAGVIGTGGASDEERFELAATQECIDIFEAANPDIEVVLTEEVPDGGSDWLTSITRICAPFRLFELSARAAGADLTHDSFLAGSETLGEIELAGRAFSSMSPGKIDADDSLRLMEFDPAIGDDGGMTPFGELTRIP